MILERSDGAEVKTYGYLLGDEGYPISQHLQTPFPSKFVIRLHTKSIF